MTRSRPSTTEVPSRLTEESEVRLGIGGTSLLFLVAALGVGGVPTPVAVAAMLATTLLLAAPLEPLHALLLGIAGGGLTDGFVIRGEGQLGLGAGDAALFAAFTVAALAPVYLRRRPA